MENKDRRSFLQTSVAALAVGLVPTARLQVVASGAADSVHAPSIPANKGKKPLRLGLIVAVGNDPDAAMAKLRDLGLPTAQIYVDEFHPGLEGRLTKALDANHIEATSVVVGGPGKEVWDFYGGPLTIGVVPRETRAARVAHIKKASDFAKLCGIPADQNLRYETGQETPITLVRTIQDVGTDNQGVNFDVANLILYGKANPVDAIELLGPYVQGIHAKDGRWPTDPKRLGEEVPIGKGKVDFPRITSRLKEMDYRGAITIEREISGPQQMEDVRAAKTYLEGLIS